MLVAGWCFPFLLFSKAFFHPIIIINDPFPLISNTPIRNLFLDSIRSVYGSVHDWGVPYGGKSNI